MLKLGYIPRCLASASSLLLASCAGYSLGGAKPSQYQNIDSIAIPQFTNATLYPRLSVLTTNSTVDAFAQDGTYKITSPHQADASLIATIREVEFEQFRANRFDTLASDELTVKLHIDWKLVKAQQVIGSGTSVGSTNFTTGDNLSLSRQNAFPLAASRTAQKIVFNLTEGF